MCSDLFSHFPGVLLFLDGPCNLLTACQLHLSTMSALKLTKRARRKDTANKRYALEFHMMLFPRQILFFTAIYEMSCYA